VRRTAGADRSRGRESSGLVACGETSLLDVTRDFAVQAPVIDHIGGYW